MVSEVNKNPVLKGSKSELVLNIVQASLLISIAISSELWFPVHQIFPSTPVFSFLGDLPLILNISITFLFIAALIIAYTRKFKPRMFLLLFCLFFMIASLFDHLRIQPWAYYYFIIILCFALKDESKHDEQNLNLIRFIMATIYIWSGIQKLNFSFLFNTYPELIEPLTVLLPSSIDAILLNLGILGPLTEIGGGLALFWERSRKAGLITLTLVHLFILVVLGPFGKAVNIIIWPWNISFMILLWILFNDENSNFSLAEIFKEVKRPFTALVILLFGILPSLSFTGFWPMYFSSALYSGNKVKSELYLPDQFSATLPELIKLNIEKKENSIILNNWTQAELNVAMYPEPEIHLEVFRTFCERYPQYENEFAMTTYFKPDIFTGEKKETTYFCDDLK